MRLHLIGWIRQGAVLWRFKYNIYYTYNIIIIHNICIIYTIIIHIDRHMHTYARILGFDPGDGFQGGHLGR